ncbi:MAG: IS110 family transposase [Halanaerobiales bacterium]|nr:IS110 family transposase [Halanaerobiales bacterium]
MEQLNYVFVGVDTHKNQHTACLLSCFHDKLGIIKTPNNPAHFDSFIQNINSLKSHDKKLVFGLEDTQGLGHSLAQWLLDQGYIVKEINPALTKRERHHSANPDKSDEIDAEAIANVLIVDFNGLPDAIYDANFKAIRQLNNQRQTMIKEQTKLKNKFHNLIHQQYPEYQKFFSSPFGKTAMAFYEKFPHPADLDYYAEDRLQKFLNDQVKSIGNNKAATILSLVNKDKKKTADAEARNTIIRGIIKQLRLLAKSLEKINNQLKKAVEKSQYQLTTMPGIDFKLAALFISNIKNIDRFESASKLARYAGLAPVEHSSGTSKNMSYKKYGCRDLNHAFYLLAVQQIGSTINGKIKNPASYKYYQKKLQEGKSQKVALTCLERRLTDIIYAMMRDRSAYKLPENIDYEVLDKAG